MSLTKTCKSLLKSSDKTQFLYLHILQHNWTFTAKLHQLLQGSKFTIINNNFNKIFQNIDTNLFNINYTLKAEIKVENKTELSNLYKLISNEKEFIIIKVINNLNDQLNNIIINLIY